MTEYLVMTREDERAHASQSPKAMSELIDKSATCADELRRAGRLKDSGRLRPRSLPLRRRRQELPETRVAQERTSPQHDPYQERHHEDRLPGANVRGDRPSEVSGEEGGPSPNYSTDALRRPSDRWWPLRDLNPNTLSGRGF